ncbi:hypothetical protein HCH_06926 [Hahella chejuensis KCTC 2396]|uniref:Uncharacterized protein n=1 Tax=Hahella chejuensis (strain KCTC 2396) TaxID=349521 RepID=Q2S731_HAHCH|nr:hypothetical protein HCH_06926 [Hahella chejuensis KCTC 2396]
MFVFHKIMRIFPHYPNEQVVIIEYSSAAIE